MLPLSQRAAAVALTAVLASGGAALGAVQAQAAPGPRTCSVRDLHLSMGRKDAAAGSLYWSIRFTNTSTRSCTLRGYPGVSVLNAAHRQIGPAATHSGQSYRTVRVTRGHTVTAVIRTANGPIGGPCRPTGTYLRVYPPGSHRSVLIPARWRVCSNIFQVSPVTAR
ncbi:DUF4232 domain-containing protein [Streptomyces sp. NBC_01537]|uniref:DUF4232 domain-containing protein n=1 Tax=Streptomyces sp. NBC_01537 TaxID=2903896 RepID=UPI00386DEA5D